MNPFSRVLSPLSLAVVTGTLLLTLAPAAKADVAERCDWRGCAYIYCNNTGDRCYRESDRGYGSDAHSRHSRAREHYSHRERPHASRRRGHHSHSGYDSGHDNHARNSGYRDRNWYSDNDIKGNDCAFDERGACDASKSYWHARDGDRHHDREFRDTDTHSDSYPDNNSWNSDGAANNSWYSNGSSPSWR